MLHVMQHWTHVLGRSRAVWFQESMACCIAFTCPLDAHVSLHAGALATSGPSVDI